MILLAACASQAPPSAPSNLPIPLAELPNLSARVNFIDTGVADFTSIDQRSLLVSLDEAGIDGLKIDGTVVCPQVSDGFHATFAGAAPMSSLYPGGWYTEPAMGGISCNPPSFQIAIPDGARMPDAALVFGDESMSVTVPLGNVLLPRTLQLAGGGDTWQLHPGEDVVVTWSPATDLAALSSDAVTFVDAAGTPQFSISNGITHTDDTFHFVLPDATATATGRLVVRVTEPDLVGPDYRVSLQQAAFHDATIGP